MMGVGIAVLRWQFFMMEIGIAVFLQILTMGFGIAVLPWQRFYEGIWDVPFYLAFCDMLFGTGRVAHRLGGLFVILGVFTLTYEDVGVCYVRGIVDLSCCLEVSMWVWLSLRG